MSGWLGPSERPIKDLGRPTADLPFALRAGLTTLSGWPSLFVQNNLRQPEMIEVVRGLALFLDENQAVCSWGIRAEELHLADPAVWMDDGHGEASRVDRHVSAFLLKMALLELIFGSDQTVASELDGVPAEQILMGLTRLDALGPAATDLWFFAGEGSIAMANITPDGFVSFAWRADAGTR